jgi:hypothetical protein
MLSEPEARVMLYISFGLLAFGVSLPGRFRFIHDAGKDYRHYIEVTLFGFPIMKVNEFYLDGKSRL